MLGKRIITACADGLLILWDPRSPTPIFKLSPDDARFNLDGITSLGVNPSSTLAVVGGAAGGVRVVSLSKGEIVGPLGGHTEGDSIEAVQFVDIAGSNAGPGVAVTGATDGKACIWDLSTMRLRSTLQHDVWISSPFRERCTNLFYPRMPLQCYWPIQPRRATSSSPGLLTKLCVHGTLEPACFYENTLDTKDPCLVHHWG